MTPSGEKDKVRFVWQLDETDSRGEPLKAFETFNLTLHPKSFLYGAVRDIVGRDPGTEFELNHLLKSEVDLVIKHSRSETGKTYANVVSHFRPKTKAEAAEEQRVAAVISLVKKANRQPTSVSPDVGIDDSDIPF